MSAKIGAKDEPMAKKYCQTHGSYITVTHKHLKPSLLKQILRWHKDRERERERKRQRETDKEREREREREREKK